jgi:hypothetical protein
VIRLRLKFSTPGSVANEALPPAADRAPANTPADSDPLAEQRQRRDAERMQKRTMSHPLGQIITDGHVCCSVQRSFVPFASPMCDFCGIAHVQKSAAYITICNLFSVICGWCFLAHQK